MLLTARSATVLALALADREASAGRPEEALTWLGVAEALDGHRYDERRRAWTLGANAAGASPETSTATVASGVPANSERKSP